MSSEIVWIMGRPASGKTTLAELLCQSIRQTGLSVLHLDGDLVRHGLNRDLGFSENDRLENLRRVSEISILAAQQGIKVVVSMITPTHKMQDFVISRMQGFAWSFIYLKCELEECIKRDPKGLYARALRREILDFTGISAPFEEPLAPDLTLFSDKMDSLLCLKHLKDFCLS